MSWFCYCLALRAYDRTNLVCLAAIILDYSKLRRSGCVNHAVFLERLGFAVCQNSHPTRGWTSILLEHLYFWKHLTQTTDFKEEVAGQHLSFSTHFPIACAWQFVNAMCLPVCVLSCTVSQFKNTLGLQKVLRRTWSSIDTLQWHFFPCDISSPKGRLLGL